MCPIVICCKKLIVFTISSKKMNKYINRKMNKGVHSNNRRRQESTNTYYICSRKYVTFVFEWSVHWRNKNWLAASLSPIDKREVAYTFLVELCESSVTFSFLTNNINGRKYKMPTHIFLDIRKSDTVITHYK